MTRHKWFTNFDCNTTAPFRLFCFPNAGGGSHTFRDWVGTLDHVEIFSILLPGRERRIMEPPLDSMATLMLQLRQSIAPFLDKPFMVFGHSLGALIAYELALQLREHHYPQPCHVFVSAYRSPEKPNPNKEMHTLNDAEFVAELQRYGGTPEAVLEHPEAMELLLPMLRADFKLHEAYRYQKRSPLDCPITALAGRHDRIVPVADMAGWADKTSDNFSHQLFDGEHFFIHESRQQVLALLQKHINAHLQDERLATSY